MDERFAHSSRRSESPLVLNRGDDNNVYFSECFPDAWEKSHDRHSKDT